MRAQLTANAKLTAGLTCAAGDGVTLDPGVTLDLGGHRLTGPGSGTGVTVTPGVTGAVMRNGTLAGWSFGVRVGEVFEEEAGATIRRVTVVGGGAHVLGGLMVVTRSTFRASPATPGQGTGVSAFFGRFRVSDSTFDGVGIGAAVTVEVTVTRSAIRNATTALDCSEAQCTLTRSRLTGNDVVYRGWDSLLTMTDTDVRDNGVGYESRTAFGQADGTPNLVQGNVFVRNDVAVRFGVGDSATVRGNQFTRNGRAVERVPLEESRLHLPRAAGEQHAHPQR